MTHVDQDQSWVAHALCAEQEPDNLFVQGSTQRQVRMVCMQCPVRIECLADALQSEANFGVWGGLTERERRAILRHYSDVTNWMEWINTSSDPLAQEIRTAEVPRVLSHVRSSSVVR